jgi:phage host-nuclease inhibitor protein Gam
MTSIPASYDELQDHLIAATEPAASPEGFRVHDESSADWALRVIGKHRRLLAVHEDVAKAQIEHTNEWLDDQRKRYLESTEYLVGLLEGYHRQLLDENPKAKTIRLPAGNLVARKAPDVVDVTDADAFVAWAEAGHDELLRVKTDPDKPKIRSALGHDAEDGVLVDPATGERVPGLAWVVGEISFKVETDT